MIRHRIVTDISYELHVKVLHTCITTNILMYQSYIYHTNRIDANFIVSIQLAEIFIPVTETVHPTKLLQFRFPYTRCTLSIPDTYHIGTNSYIHAQIYSSVQIYLLRYANNRAHRERAVKSKKKCVLCHRSVQRKFGVC